MDTEIEVYTTNKHLSTNLMLHNSIEVFRLFEAREPRRIGIHDPDSVRETIARLEVHLDVMAITEALKDFEAKVWFGASGLQAAVRGTCCRDVGARCGTLSVLSYTIAGRTMITLADSSLSDERGDKHVTLVADETSKEPRSGLGGISATAAEAIQFFQRAVKEFEAGNLKFVAGELVASQRPA